MVLSSASAVKACSLCLPGSRSALALLAGCDTAETTERRQGAIGANLFQQREAVGDGSDGLWGDVRTCLSHGWSASTCAGLHIWKRSRCREGGVNANEQERQCCYICTSSIQKRRWSLRHTLMRTEWLFRFSLILNCILEKGTTAFFNFSVECHESCMKIALVETAFITKNNAGQVCSCSFHHNVHVLAAALQ